MDRYDHSSGDQFVFWVRRLHLLACLIRPYSVLYNPVLIGNLFTKEAVRKRHQFQLGGQTCEQATAAILKVYPPLTVVCEKESAEPKIVDDDENRFVVYTDDDSGDVSEVHFNRKAERRQNTSCEFAGQKCYYESRQGSCYVRETRICVGSETGGFLMECDRQSTCSWTK